MQFFFGYRNVLILLTFTEFRLCIFGYRNDAAFFFFFSETKLIQFFGGGVSSSCNIIWFLFCFFKGEVACLFCFLLWRDCRKNAILFVAFLFCFLWFFVLFFFFFLFFRGLVAERIQYYFRLERGCNIIFGLGR